MMASRPILAVLLCSIAVASIGSLETGSAERGRLALDSWQWSAGDAEQYASPDFDDASWTKVVSGQVLKLGKPGDIFWLRLRVPAADLEKFLGGLSAMGDDGSRGLWFITGKAGFAADIYANSVYVGSRGTIAPFDARRTRSSVIHIPANLVSSGSDLLLALRCAFRGSSIAMPSYSIGNSKAVDFDLGLVNFWNGGLYSMLGALCLFLGFYFLVLFAFRTAERENLFFGLCLSVISIYFYEMGAEYLHAGPMFRALSRAALPFSFSFLFCFFATFFHYGDRLWAKIGSILLGLVFAVAFIAVRNDESVVDLVFTLSLIPIFASIVFGLVSSIHAVRQGSREALPVLIGIAIGILFASYDIYFQVTTTTPFAWLQGIAFFALDISIFVSLSMRQATLKEDLERLARESKEGAESLESSLGRLKKAGAEADEIGRELESAVAAVAMAIGRSDEGAARVDREARSQAVAAGEADGIVAGFLESIDRVNGSLAEQSANIERTAASAAQLSAGVESVAANIDRTAEFAGSLSTLTDEGEKAASALAAAVDRVAESSRGIVEIVDAMNEFAEKTNLLSMNASIEAAHSGIVGRGFSVIAAEIKKLALLQSEKAGRIAESVAEIGSRAEAGRADAERVRSSLKAIAEGARMAADRLVEVKEGSREQRGASADVRAAMEALASSGRAIRDEADRQIEYSGKVREAVRAMTAGADATRGSAAAIAKESAGIVEAVRSLRELTAKSRDLTAELGRGVKPENTAAAKP